jgi:hypothetical protein
MKKGLNVLGAHSTIWTFSNIVAVLSMVVSASVAIWTYKDSQRPKEAKMTIKTDYRKCFNDNIECSQLFIYTNDDAPCFDMRLKYNSDEYKDIRFLKDFNKSNLFYAEPVPNGYSYPAMTSLMQDRKGVNTEAIFGFLPTKTQLYYAFYPIDSSKKHTVQVECAGDSPIDIVLKGKG